MNGVLDSNEDFTHTDVDGFYQFPNLTYNVYPVNHRLPEFIDNVDTCSAVEPDIMVHLLLEIVMVSLVVMREGYPDIVYEYFDSSRGGLDGLELGHPHGGLIEELVRVDGVPMSNKLVNINITDILGNNVEWTLILSENSYVTLGFYHDYILNNQNNSLVVNFLYEVNDEDWLRVNIRSENNRDWYYLGDITKIIVFCNWVVLTK